LERLRFANSGTEAVMMAIRTARAHSGRHTIIRFRGAYHGTFEDVVDGAHAEADAIVVDFNDADGLRVAASGAEIAAILVDLMPNRAGMIEATPMFIQAIHETAEATGALIIADEVITARLGGGGLSPQLGLRPDLVALGKIIGGGHPVGAFGGRSDVMAVYQPGAPRRIGHGGTFTANPVTMAAGRAALLAFGEDEVQRIDALGERLRRSLSDAGMDVAGRGSLVRIRSAADGRLWWAAYREGVLIGNNGLLAVSTAMDESVIDLVADRLQQAVATVTETSLS
jgi:glutamate-1-semialdehyde 2,1-aminomutase